MASGNFPFAFAPHELAADPSAWPGNSMARFPDSFTYVDGGMFNNEPLGEAVRLARRLDQSPGHLGLDPSRIFLLVDANLNRSKHDPDFDRQAPLPTAILRTLTVLTGEASALDWLNARRVNNEIGWRNAILQLIAGLVEGTEVEDPQRLLTGLEQAADDIVDEKRRLFPERYPADYREAAVTRRLNAYADLTADMEDMRRRIFGTLAFLLNSVAGLDRKDKLNLHVIYTTPGQTAGDRMQSLQASSSVTGGFTITRSAGKPRTRS